MDEDITVNMEMAKHYENWQQEKPNQNLKTAKNDSLHFVDKSSPEKDDNDLEFTRCHGQIEKLEVPPGWWRCHSKSNGNDENLRKLQTGKIKRAFSATRNVKKC